MTEQSRRGPEKQRAPLAPSRKPLVPESREAEELETRAAATAARATMAAAAATSGPPPGITLSTALSLARRVGNRRFGQWVARQGTTRVAATLDAAVTDAPVERVTPAHPAGSQTLVRGPRAEKTPDNSRSGIELRPPVGFWTSGSGQPEWSPVGLRRQAAPTVRRQGFNQVEGKVGDEYDTAESGGYNQEYGKIGPEVEAGGPAKAPVEPSFKPPSDIRSPFLMANPFEDTSKAGVEQATSPGLTPSGLMPNPFGDTKAGVEQGMKLGPEIGPGTTQPNPFTDQKKWGPELTPSGTMPNPFVEQGEKQGTEIGPGTTQPNPFTDQKKWGPELTPSGTMPNPFVEQGEKQGTEIGPRLTMPNPFEEGTKAGSDPTSRPPAGSQTKAGSDTEAQTIVGKLASESADLGPRDTALLGPPDTAGDQVQSQAQDLANTGQVQAATEDHTAREEAAAEEGAVMDHGPVAQPEAGSDDTNVEPAAPHDPDSEAALARVRQIIESVVSRMLGMLNPIGSVLSALVAIGNVVTDMARSLSRAVTPIWQAVSGAIQSAVSFVTRQASSLLASARAAAQRVVEVVTSTLGGAADAVMERIRQLRRATYARVVQLVASARHQGIARLTGLVTSVIDRIRTTGQQIRAGIQAAVTAVRAAIAAARSAARGELDRLLGSGRQVGAVRARLRAWARARLRGLARSVLTGRTAVVSTLRTALFAVVGHIGLLWQAAEGSFRETFAEPIAQAWEHVPELVGQVEMGFAQAESQVSQPGPAADLELALVERELNTAAAHLTIEAEETGSTL